MVHWCFQPQADGPAAALGEGRLLSNDYLMLVMAIGVPLTFFFLLLSAIIKLGYEIEATIWSMPI